MTKTAFPNDRAGSQAVGPLSDLAPKPGTTDEGPPTDDPSVYDPLPVAPRLAPIPPPPPPPKADDPIGFKTSK